MTEFTVNGRPCRSADPEVTLLAYLRDELGLMGTKNGCAQGHCGACTVIVDGAAQRSCLVKLGRLQGARVETIESLATAETVHPLQFAFVAEGAVQCGFCTPGMIMAAKALLDADPDPDEPAIRRALAHNLCRCTGYVKIVAAVRRAAAMLRAGERAVPRGRLAEMVKGGVGASVPRLDGLERATGELRYTADLNRPGQLYGRVLRSTQAHAEIVSLDVSAAWRMPGVVAVLTAADIPGQRTHGLIVADQPVLAWERVRTVGDGLAVVLAESEAQAAASLATIRVEYRPLPVVNNPEEALHPETPAIHEGGNLLREVHVRKGDGAAGLAGADVVVEGTYHTPFVEHAYMEPEACLAEHDGQGGVTVHVGSQGPWIDRQQIARSLGLPLERVRVVHMPVGGGFGGKEDITLQIFAALGALATGRPVKMVMSRAESIAVSTKRHAETIHFRTGATHTGRLVAMQVTIHADTGAYASLGPSVLFRSASFCTGPYAVPHVQVDAYACYTNNPPAGAMRGFGSPQVAFAAESQMDELARALGMDPFELRLQNLLTPGATTAMGEVLHESVGARETLLAVREALAREPLPQPRPGTRIGVGLAASYKNVGLGGGLDDRAECIIELRRDGTLVVRVGCADLGQGAETAMAQIVAEVTGVPLAAIRVHAGDTAVDPQGAMTTASRETFISGNAVLVAARAWRQAALQAAAQELGCAPCDVRIADGGVVGGAAGERMALADWAERLAARGAELRVHERYAAPETQPYRDTPAGGADPAGRRLHAAYCFGAQAAVVQVDEQTGEVEVLRLIAAHDAGRILNPLAVQGQIEGGVMMGLGYALTEELVLREGQVVTDTLRKLGIPTITRLPRVEALLIENPHREGPLGAKGMAELPAAATAPAIANAIYDAIGVRIRELPATPQRVVDEQRNRRTTDEHR